MTKTKRKPRKPSSPRKSTTPSDVITGTLGRQTISLWHPHDMKRVELRSLLLRFGRWVHLCVTKRAQTAASIRPRLFVIGAKEQVQKMRWLKPKDVDRKTKHFLRGNARLSPGTVAMKRLAGNVDDLTEVFEHPALDVLDNVNDWEDGYGFRVSRYADLCMFGRVFTNIIAPSDDAPPVALWRMQPHITKVIPHQTDFVSGFEYGRGPDKRTFKTSDVHWVRLHDPDDPWGGFGPLEAWLQTFDADFTMVAFQQWLFNRGGTPDVLLTVKSMTDSQKKQLRSSWRSMFGNMANREESLAILEGENGDVKQLSSKPREMEFMASRELIRDEACAAFGVPKSMVTTDDVNKANASETNPQFITNTIWPDICRMEDADNQRLLPRWSDRLVLIHENPLAEDQEIVIKQRESKLKSGYSVNEIRMDEGQEPCDDPMADKPMIATGIVPLENITEAGKPPPAPVIAGLGGRPKPKEPVKAYESLTKAIADLAALAGTLVQVNGRHDRNLGEHDASRNSRSDGDRSASGQDGSLVHGESKQAAGDATEGLAGQAGSHHACGSDCSGHDAGSDGVEKSATAMMFKAATPPGDDDEIVKLFAAAVDHELRIQIELVIEQMEKAKQPIDAKHDAMNWLNSAQGQADINRAARQFMVRTLDMGGQSGLVELESLPPGISFDVSNPEVQRYVDQAIVRLSNGVNGYTKERLNEILGDGLAQGETIPQLTARVQEWAGKVGDPERGTMSRAMNIARTESADAYMAGKIEGWKQSGVVTAKKWLLASDACSFCRAAAKEYNAAPVPLDQPFYTKGHILTDAQGNKMKLDYKDIYGPTLHPQCRCALEPVLREDVV